MHFLKFRRISRAVKLFIVLTSLLVIFPVLLPHAAAMAETDGEQPVIIFAGDSKYPPYEFLDKNGEPAGFTVEITKALAEVMGMKIEIRLGPWDKMRAQVEKGEVHILQGTSYSDERSRIFSFSQPYTMIQHSIFARTDAPEVSKLEDLKGKKVLVQRNGIMHDTIKNNGMGIIPVPTEYQGSALRQLAAGKYDYAIVANLPGIYYIREFKLTNVKPVGSPVAVQKFCYAAVRGHPDLITRISEGLAILKKTGRLRKIQDRWLGLLERDIALKQIIWTGVILFGIMTVLILANVIWTRALKRQVSLRTEELKNEIRERKRAAKELETRQKQLIQADKMASLGFLVTGIAHELNNPNGLILLNLPVLIETFEDATPILEAHYKESGDFKLGGLSYSRMRDEIPHILDETRKASTQIRSIVEDLKDFGRESSEHEKEPCPINDLIESSLRLVRKAIEKSTSNFQVEYGEDIPPVTVNPQRIEQVIINLLLNSCQSLPDRNRGIFLKTGYDNTKKKVTISVMDEGKGIAEEHLKYLTDPFFTTKRNEGGTGLGLFISAGIVQSHGGTLEFESTSGKGTRVTLSLPYYYDASGGPAGGQTFKKFDK